MRQIDPKDWAVQPFTAFGDNWMALAAGTQAGYNAMTIAWGHLGSLWERGSHANRLPTAICYVRPTRYTKEFLDREPYFTLNAFSGEYRKALGYLGSHSGRDGEKAGKAGLAPVFDRGTVYFAQAETVYVCRKLYHAPLEEAGFADQELVEFNYPRRDFHEVYIGEVVAILTK